MANLSAGCASSGRPASVTELAMAAVEIDHYDPLYLANRVAMYRQLHAEGRPVRHSTKHGGFWFVSGYPEALEVQRRAEDFSNKERVVPSRPIAPMIPSGLNPPEHKPVKIALTKLFLPSAVAELRAKLIRTAHRLFDECTTGRDTFDVVQDLMFPLMGEFTMVDMLGLDHADAARYAAVIHTQSRPVPDVAQAEKMRGALAALDAEMRVILTEKRYDPTSMLAKIATLDVEGRNFSIEEMLHVAFNLITGGFGTTAVFSGTIFVFLARNPDLRTQIVADPAIIPTAFEEMLRLFTPTQTFARRVEHDTELAGVKMREGEVLLMSYGAANFDPRQFPDPEAVDLRRTPNRHMGLGTGPHRCLGEAIARLVVCEVLRLMVERIPDYELVEEGVVAQGLSSSMFGYAHVPIRFGAPG